MATMKCVKPGDYRLTIGQQYEVTPVANIGDLYEVIDDQGKPKQCFKWRFEEIKPTTVQTKAKDTQVGGAHYTKYAIQPYEYITANGLGMIEGNVIKYVTRWKDKNGVEDLKKALHSLRWLIEWEEKNEGNRLHTPEA